VPSNSTTGNALGNARTLEAQAQEVLDELWGKHLIPFKLNVGKLSGASDLYTIHFHDSRIFTAHVPLNQGQSWKVMVRSAVLARVAKLSDPLQS
jgi:hypothetical protein